MSSAVPAYNLGDRFYSHSKGYYYYNVGMFVRASFHGVPRGEVQSPSLVLVPNKLEGSYFSCLTALESELRRPRDFISVARSIEGALIAPDIEDAPATPGSYAVRRVKCSRLDPAMLKHCRLGAAHKDGASRYVMEGVFLAMGSNSLGIQPDIRATFSTIGTPQWPSPAIKIETLKVKLDPLFRPDDEPAYEQRTATATPKKHHPARLGSSRAHP